MKEIWKPIFGGVYEVSNHGRVRRAAWHTSITKNGGVLKPQLRGRYLCVNISINGQIKHKSVHLLVAEAFLGVDDMRRQVDHVDGNRLNNAVDNLEYVTGAENVRRAVQKGNFPLGERHHSAVLDAEKVAEIRRRYQAGNAIPLAREFKVARATIHKIVKRRSWKHV